MVRSIFHRWFLLAWVTTLSLSLGAQDTTVILLRHAERQSLFDGDSPLSEVGQNRAASLVSPLTVLKPTTLYASDLRRTQQTLAPLAVRLGMAIKVHAKDETDALAAEILREHRGRTVLVCWHHDRMKKLLRALGVKGAAPYWSLDTYDWLWIIRIPAQGEPMLETKKQELAPTPAAIAERH